MANDPPYGGRIRVQQDGSALWILRERSFPSNRDADGVLEYAIRVVDGQRNVLVSTDGKCLLTVHPTQTNVLGKAKFLIVSGYETKAAPTGAKIVGKSYFITADRYDPEDQVNPNGPPIPPSYDVILRYDDYDLEHSDLPEDLDATALEVCYLKWEQAPDGTWKDDWGSVSEIASAVLTIPGSRSITVKGLNSPATFALMHHDPH